MRVRSKSWATDRIEALLERWIGIGAGNGKVGLLPVYAAEQSGTTHYRD
jgi:hypothetical protein